MNSIDKELDEAMTNLRDLLYKSFCFTHYLPLLNDIERKFYLFFDNLFYSMYILLEETAERNVYELN